MINDDYTPVSVEQTAPPESLDGGDGYRYTIRQGANIIRGYQQGSLETVRQ